MTEQWDFRKGNLAGSQHGHDRLGHALLPGQRDGCKASPYGVWSCFKALSIWMLGLLKDFKGVCGIAFCREGDLRADAPSMIEAVLCSAACPRPLTLAVGVFIISLPRNCSS